MGSGQRSLRLGSQAIKFDDSFCSRPDFVNVNRHNNTHGIVIFPDFHQDDKQFGSCCLCVVTTSPSGYLLMVRAYSNMAVSFNVFYKLIYPLHGLFVLCLPVLVAKPIESALLAPKNCNFELLDTHVYPLTIFFP